MVITIFVFEACPSCSVVAQFWMELQGRVRDDGYKLVFLFYNVLSSPVNECVFYNRNRITSLLHCCIACVDGQNGVAVLSYVCACACDPF